MNKLLVGLIYLGAVVVCLSSYGVLVHLNGNYGSNLAWLVVRLSEHMVSSVKMPAHSPGDIFTIATIAASMVVALPFPIVFLLISNRRLYLRIPGIVLACGLLYLTCYWFRTPLEFF